MEQASQNYILLKISLLAILLSIHACDKCSSQKHNPPITENNRGNQNLIPIGHVTLGQYNQQNHPVAKQLKLIGNGACTCIVGTLLKEFQTNQQDLHQNPEKIDKIIESGIQFYASSFATDAARSRATFIEGVLQKLNFKQDQTTMVDPYGIGVLQTKNLASESAIEQEVNIFKDSKKLAVIRVGPEAWGLISHGDGTFDLFDPHGRPEENFGNTAAFIKRLDPLKAAQYIWPYSLSQPGVYIYWLE